MDNSIWCQNYETWDWEDFDLSALEPGAVVLALIEGDYWMKYTKTAPDVWLSDEEDEGTVDDKTLAWETLAGCRDEWVLVAPRGLVGDRSRVITVCVYAWRAFADHCV